MAESLREPTLCTREHAHPCPPLAHGDTIAAHFHDFGQLRYAASGALVSATAVGAWVAPPSRIMWVPPLKAVTDLLHADPSSPATLTELGRRTGASERTLSRLFARDLSMSFHQWRTLLRIQHALLALTEGASVTDVALRLGWSNPSSFIEAVVRRSNRRHDSRHASARQGAVVP